MEPLQRLHKRVQGARSNSAVPGDGEARIFPRVGYHWFFGSMIQQRDSADLHRVAQERPGAKCIAGDSVLGYPRQAV